MTDPLAGRFAGFDADISPLVRSAGTEAAHRTVRRRHRVRSSALAAVAVLAVGAPLLYTNVRGDGTTPAAPAPSISAVPAETPDPNRLALADITEGTLDVPPWAADAVGAAAGACPSGRLAFSAGEHPFAVNRIVRVEQVVHVDVDQDGAKEAVARLSCGVPGQPVAGQVIVLVRAGDAVRTFGRVLAQTGVVRAICDVRPGENKYTVEVKAASQPLTADCDLRSTEQVWTGWGTFYWQDGAFTKVGGPFKFDE